MKSLFLFISLIIASSPRAQTGTFELNLKKGKEAFEKEYNQKIFLDAIVNLEKATKLRPDNPEAHYFLGYAYSRLNFNGANKLTELSPQLIFKSSQQFELVNKLSPLYKGEYLILDPYSKITAEWGTLSMYYWYYNKKDSAIWALNEGKKRGGFSEYFLQLNKIVLDKCSKDAILITSGDNNSFSLWYLQLKENYRNDVAVINGGLLDLNWYTDLLYDSKKVSFDVSKSELDSFNYSEWEETIITIKDFSWSVKPNYENSYLTRSAKVFLSILQANQFKRDIYFSFGNEESSYIGLNEFFQSHILLDKVDIKNSGSISDKEFSDEITEIHSLIKKLNLNSQQEHKSIDYIKFSILVHSLHFFKAMDYERAKTILAAFDNSTPLKSIPYFDKNIEKLENYVRQELSTAK